MSERYNVSASAVLGENYKITNIECSDYNPSIDGNITVTITVNDVYGDAISGESVTVTASEGTFTQLNGSDITAASSVTGTTNSSGQFTLTYNCSVWGLITFSANNRAIQVHVTGWREITAGTGKLWVNDETKTAVFHFTRAGAITSEVTYANAIPSTYRPYSNVRMIAHNSPNTIIKLGVESNGTVRLISSSYGSTSLNVACQITYAYGV